MWVIDCGICCSFSMASFLIRISRIKKPLVELIIVLLKGVFLQPFLASVEFREGRKILIQSCFIPVPFSSDRDQFLALCQHVTILYYCLVFEYFIQSRDLGMLLVLLQQCL